MTILIILTSLLTFTSCQKEYDCDLLAMQYYRGLPKQSAQYKKHCSGKTLKYTPEKCQQALKYLSMTGDEKKIKKKFGERIFECFNKSDLDRFL
jgi:hypothetical protein